jgi:hypothetical protein
MTVVEVRPILSETLAADVGVADVDGVVELGFRKAVQHASPFLDAAGQNCLASSCEVKPQLDCSEGTARGAHWPIAFAVVRDAQPVTLAATLLERRVTMLASTPDTGHACGSVRIALYVFVAIPHTSWHITGSPVVAEGCVHLDDDTPVPVALWYNTVEQK